MSHVVPFHLRDLHSASKADATGLSNARNPSALYPRKATRIDQEPKIPDPKLFASLARTTPGNSDLPTMGECAVHLELLEVFHKLRLDIINSKNLDTTFGVKIDNRTVYRKIYSYPRRRYIMKPVQLRDTTWPTRRRQKWSYFLDIAAGRFKVWMAKMNDFLLKSQDRQLPHLPPLDVLMVWHAFLLNPHDYVRTCRRNGHSCIATLPFPWKVVHAAIDSRTWTYALPESSALWTRAHANLEPNLFHYLHEISRVSSNVLATTLARYGQQDATMQILFLDEQLDVKELAERDSAFLATLQQIEAGKEANKSLVQNVLRQASFVDKMYAQLWIRSPAVEGTLRRAADRYEKFLRLFQLYPGKTIVPTLDIDLVWHTHQCSARAYAASVKRHTGVFINHDDKLGRPVLDDGMQRTKELFFMRFGEEYDKCLCWDCETMVSVIEEADDSVSPVPENVSSLAERVRKDVEYYRCVEISRRAGDALPICTPSLDAG